MFCGLAGSTAGATPGSPAGAPSNHVFGTLDGPAKAQQDSNIFKTTTPAS